jgi:hypothetical protein
MEYKIKKAKFNFEKDGRKLKSIEVTASMPFNDNDVRTICAESNNYYWKPRFDRWDESILEFLLDVAAHGSEL